MKNKLPELSITEIILIRSSLTTRWQQYVKDKCPGRAKSLDKYHQWCRIEEKDRMSDLYWIQSIRKKLNEYEDILLKGIK